VVFNNILRKISERCIDKDWSCTNQ